MRLELPASLRNAQLLRGNRVVVVGHWYEDTHHLVVESLSEVN